MNTMTLDALASREAPASIRRARSEWYKVYLALSEALILIPAAAVAEALLQGAPPFGPRHLALGAISFFVLSTAFRTYTTRMLTRPAAAFPRVAAAAVLSLAWTWASGLRAPDAAALVALAAALGLMLANRILVRSVLGAVFARGAGFRRAVVIDLGGSGRVAREILKRSDNGIRPVASVPMSAFSAEQAIAVARRERADLVVIEVPWERMAEALAASESLRVLPADIAVVPDIPDGTRLALGLDATLAEPLARSYGHMVAGWGAVAKRAEDIVVSSLMLLVASPVMIAVAIAIRIESPGSVIFRQRRVGFNEEVFEVWKFRSMHAATADAGGARQTSRGDARVTRVGRLIRRTSLDELPQLVNVLRGTMSVVGPRPHPLEMRALGQHLDAAVPSYRLRHRVKPGLTGLAQVSGYRGEIDSVEKLQGRVRHDLEYIERWSLGLDLRIIARTAVKVILDKSAY